MLLIIKLMVMVRVRVVESVVKFDHVMTLWLVSNLFSHAEAHFCISNFLAPPLPPCSGVSKS